MGVFSDGELTPEERGELSPEQRIGFLEKRVENLRKAEVHFWDSALLALSQIHTIVEVLQAEGIIEAGELEEMRQKTLEAIKRIEKAKDNGG